MNLIKGIIVQSPKKFLMTRLSSPLWGLFPLADYILFPWRILTIGTYSFPGWTAYIDREMVEIGKDPGGLMVLTIPEGRHEVDIKFEDTLVRKAANFVSFLVLTTILILFYSHKRREIIKRYPDPPDGK